MAKGSTFSLQFDADKIDEIRRRYDDATDHEATAAGRRARGRGYYTKPEFITVCRWKSPRISGRAAKNAPGAIHRQTCLAFRASDEEERMRSLIELAWVGIPVASTLLHFAFPRLYPIIDWRALESLGQKRRSTYSIIFWLSYLDAAAVSHARTTSSCAHSIRHSGNTPDRPACRKPRSRSAWPPSLRS